MLVFLTTGLSRAHSTQAASAKSSTLQTSKSIQLAQLSDIDDTENLDDEVQDDTPAPSEPAIIDDEPDEFDEPPRSANDDTSSPTADTTPDTSPTTPPPPDTVNTRDSYSAEGPSQKIFDWDKHRNQKEVPHPFAAKGLLRIQKDGTYVYRVDETKQKAAIGVRFAMFVPENLSNPNVEAGARGASFDENYDQTSTPAVLIDYEWNFWNSPIGKWSLRAGSGLYVAQGHGHFESASNADLEPREVFTFVVVPLNVSAVYRLQLWHKQLIVPYAEGGATAFGFTELRDDNRPPKFGGSPASFFALGGALNLTYFDNVARIQMDREYGINRVYLTAEYRYTVSLKTDYDFTGELINAGFLMEY